LFLLYFGFFCWVAVAWHRYALRQEPPGRILPRWNGAEAAKYAGASVRILLVTILAATLVAILASVVAAIAGSGSFDSNQPGPLSFLFQLLVGFVFMRFSLVLPEAALGGRMKLGESWSTTATFWKPILVAQLVSQLFFTIPFWIAQTPLGAPLNGFAYFTIASWLQIMVGISIVTTLYGFIVEKRDLR